MINGPVLDQTPVTRSSLVYRSYLRLISTRGRPPMYVFGRLSQPPVTLYSIDTPLGVYHRSTRPHVFSLGSSFRSSVSFVYPFIHRSTLPYFSLIPTTTPFSEPLHRQSSWCPSTIGRTRCWRSNGPLSRKTLLPDPVWWGYIEWLGSTSSSFVVLLGTKDVTGSS